MAKLVVYDAANNFYPTGYFNIVTHLVQNKNNYEKFLLNTNKGRRLDWLKQFADNDGDPTNTPAGYNTIIKHIKHIGPNNDQEEVAIGSPQNQRNCMVVAHQDVK